MAGARCRHRCRVERELLIGRREQLNGIRAATGEQNAVVGKQSSGVTTARHGQVPKSWRKQLRGRIEYFRGAGRFTAGDEHQTVIQDRSCVTRARRRHRGREHPKAGSRVYRIKNFRGRQWAGVSCAARYEYAAIGQPRGGVIHARGGERCAGGRGLRFRIKDF
jgi:hypothetical protein